MNWKEKVNYRKALKDAKLTCANCIYCSNFISCSSAVLNCTMHGHEWGRVGRKMFCDRGIIRRTPSP